MAKDQPTYLSYLLRLWRVDEDDEPGGEESALWRASLQSALTGERQTFAGLDDLLSHLREQMGVSSSSNADENCSGV